MGNQNFTGIGCFAKPERLRRIFNKLMQEYALGPLDGDQLGDQNILAGGAGAELLKALVAGPTIDWPSDSWETTRVPEEKKITGFYLSFLDQKLNLAVFTGGTGSKQQIYTATLEELTRLRQKRLN